MKIKVYNGKTITDRALKMAKKLDIPFESCIYALEENKYSVRKATKWLKNGIIK